jgi:hypothetical protein
VLDEVSTEIHGGAAAMNEKLTGRDLGKQKKHCHIIAAIRLSGTLGSKI